MKSLNRSVPSRRICPIARRSTCSGRRSRCSSESLSRRRGWRDWWTRRAEAATTSGGPSSWPRRWPLPGSTLRSHGSRRRCCWRPLTPTSGASPARSASRSAPAPAARLRGWPGAIGSVAYDRAVAAGARESRRSGAPTAVVVADGAGLGGVSDRRGRRPIGPGAAGRARAGQPPRRAHGAGPASRWLALRTARPRLRWHWWWVQVDEGAAPSLASGVGWTIAVEVAAGAALVAGSVAGLLRDQRRLRRRASTDSLTGLPNRAEFERRRGRPPGHSSAATAAGRASS